MGEESLSWCVSGERPKKPQRRKQVLLKLMDIVLKRVVFWSAFTGKMYILSLLDFIWKKLTTLIVGLILILQHSRLKSFRFLQLAMKIPGPSMWELFAYHSERLLSKNLADHVCKLSLDYNNKPWTLWLGLHAIVVSDPATIADVFKSKYLTSKDKLLYETVEELIGKSSLSLNGPEWKVRRKINNGAFTKPQLERFVGIIYEEAENLVKKVREHVAEEDIDIYHCVENALICSSFQSLGGQDFTVDDIMTPEELSKMSYYITMAVRVKAINPMQYYYQKFQKHGREIAMKYETLARNLRQKILKKRENFFHKVNTEGKSPESALEFLLEATNQKEGISEDEVISEMKLLLAAAIDTTSTVTTATLLLLALHPDIQRRVAEEIESVFGGSDRPILLEDLQRLEYLERVIKEALRLFPPIPMLIRKADEEANLNGTLVPKGCSVIMDLMALQRHRDNFKDPMVCDPDRFAPGVEERHPFSFIPFSSGSRRCIGRAQGILAAKTVVSTLLRNFRLLPGRELNSVADIKHEFSFIMHMRGNFVRAIPLNETSS